MSEPRRWTLWARGNDEVARARESDPKIAIGAGLVEVEVVESSALAASEARREELLRERDEALGAVRAARSWMHHHRWCDVCNDYMNDSPYPEDHPACTCGAEAAFDIVLKVIPDEFNPPDTDGILAWRERRKEEAKMLKDLAAQVATLREALKELAVLGNGDRPGNSIGNRIAQRALAATAPKGDANEQAR